MRVSAVAALVAMTAAFPATAVPRSGATRFEQSIACTRARRSISWTRTYD